MLNLKFALRTLFKTPFVTIVAIVSLALGIGANAAIFSLFNQVLLKPVAVPEPSRLVNLAAPGHPLRLSRVRVNSDTSLDRFAIILSGLHPALHHARGRS